VLGNDQTIAPMRGLKKVPEYDIMDMITPPSKKFLIMLLNECCIIFM